MRALAALVLAAYLVPLAVPVPLMEDDEGLHAAIATEMVERGDWAVPRLMGQPFLDKPILYFWLQAASIAAFGASEFAVRLPGTLTALAGAIATGWLARVLFGATPALGAWGALVYATMLLPYAVSLSPLHDLVMVPLVAVAFGAFWKVHHAPSTAAAAQWTLVAGVALGLSMLGKGLTGVGLIGVGMAAWMAWTRTWSWRLVGAGAAALAIGTAIAWPWYAAMEAASPGYLRYFIVDRHIGGVAGDEQRHAGRPFWYYVPVLVAGTWPWIAAAARRRPARADLAERLVWSWLVADFVLLSAAGSKLATYLLPALPAVALLAARAIVDANDDADPAPGWLTVSTAAIPVLAAVAYAQWMAPEFVSGWELVVVVPLVVAGFFSVSTLGRAWSGSQRLLCVTAITLLCAALGGRPLVATYLTARGLSETMNAAGRLPQQLLIVDEGVGSFLFYLRPELRRGLTPDRVQRVSRFSILDRPPLDDRLVAISVDRLSGVRNLFDLPPGGDGPIGSFHVVPWSTIHPRVQ